VDDVRVWGGSRPAASQLARPAASLALIDSRPADRMVTHTRRMGMREALAGWLLCAWLVDYPHDNSLEAGTRNNL